MEINNVHIPVEIFLNIFKNLDFKDIKNLTEACSQFRNIIEKNFDYIFTHSYISSVRDVYQITMTEVSHLSSIERKLKGLIDNHGYETRRLSVLNNTIEADLYSYEKNVSEKGFQKFRTYTRLRMANFCDYNSYLMADLIQDDKIFLIYTLRDFGFTENKTIEVLMNYSIENIYYLINLVRLGVTINYGMSAVENLNSEQKQHFLNLKKEGFPDYGCDNISLNYSSQQINKMIMLKRSGFHFNQCIQCATQLDEEKFLLLTKLKYRYPNHNYLVRLVFTTTIRNLNEILKDVSG